MTIPDDLANVLREPTPCDGCEWVQRCASEELSCAAFSWFVYGGRRWRRAPREPTRAHFAKLFSSADARPDSRRGLRPATLAKFESLRALRGTFPSVASALNTVGLAQTYWHRIVARDAALADHVRSLVQPSADGTLPITRCGRTRAPV